MQKIDTYLIEWYGPFSSKEELIEWEDAHSDIFNLYAFQAKQTGEKDKYYCGMALKQSVGKRLKNHDHHIHDFEKEETTVLQIWIGTIANIKPKEHDVRVCENIITCFMASKLSKQELENRNNKKPPINDVYIINEWWKTNGYEIKKKTNGSIPAVIPEVMVYYCEGHSLYGTYKLKMLEEF